MNEKLKMSATLNMVDAAAMADYKVRKNGVITRTVEIAQYTFGTLSIDNGQVTISNVGVVSRINGLSDREIARIEREKKVKMLDVKWYRVLTELDIKSYLRAAIVTGEAEEFDYNQATEDRKRK